MRLPDPLRSRAVLIGTSEYAESGLPDIPAIETTIDTLAATLTDPEYGQVPSDPEHCVTIVNEGDLRKVGSWLGTAAEDAADLLFVYYAGRVLLDKRTRALHLGLPDSDPKRPGFNSLEFSILRDTLLDSRAIMKVLVLDSHFPAGIGGLSGAMDQLDLRGGYVLASSFGEEASSVPVREIHTAFSWHLNEVLRDGVRGGPGLLRADDIYTHLLNQMRHYGLPEPEARGSYADGPLALLRNRGSLSVPKLVTQTGPTISLVVEKQEPRIPESSAEPDSLVEPEPGPEAGEPEAPGEDEEPARWFNEWMLDWMARFTEPLTDSASAVATTLLARATASVEPGSERYAWFASRLARALFRAGELDKAQDLVSLALDCTEDADVRVHLNSTLAQCVDKAGSPAEALNVLGRALAAPGLTTRHRAGLLVLAARSHNNLGDFPKAAQIAGEALKAANDAGDEEAADWALQIITMANAMAAADTDFAKLQEC